MKKAEVEVGKVYWCRVSGKMTRVRITSLMGVKGTAINLATGRGIRISPRRLQGEATVVHDAKLVRKLVSLVGSDTGIGG